MCLFRTRSVEENRLVFFINEFVEKNLKEYGDASRPLKEGLLLINNLTDRAIEFDPKLFDDEQLLLCLKGKIKVREVKKIVESKPKT